jgi:hypothetical protein
MDPPEEEKVRPLRRIMSNLRTIGRHRGGELARRELSEAHFEVYDVASTVSGSGLLCSFAQTACVVATRLEGQATATRARERAALHSTHLSVFELQRHHRVAARLWTVALAQGGCQCWGLWGALV